MPPEFVRQQPVGGLQQGSIGLHHIRSHLLRRIGQSRSLVQGDVALGELLPHLRHVRQPAGYRRHPLGLPPRKARLRAQDLDRVGAGVRFRHRSGHVAHHRGHPGLYPAQQVECPVRSVAGHRPYLDAFQLAQENRYPVIHTNTRALAIQGIFERLGSSAIDGYEHLFVSHDPSCIMPL
ncbi:MAG: hypothetical protein OXS29_11370 [bacterium]|nr:hypothetical protein [bacterium]MDE0287912.1 hypothetical protein [bacterium]MDE0439709.1 hypothetical protein [bacterium]